MTTGATGDRYLVISADCHAGADIHEYRDYLERRYHDEFDAWVARRTRSRSPTCAATTATATGTTTAVCASSRPTASSPR